MRRDGAGRGVATGAGQYYAVNVPLKDGIDDDTYNGLFRPVIDRIMEAYRPEAVVFQCGARRCPKAAAPPPRPPGLFHVVSGCTCRPNQGILVVAASMMHDM